MGDKWLISSFEVGDAHVSVQNGSEESVVGVSQGYGHPIIAHPSSGGGRTKRGTVVSQTLSRRAFIL